MRNSWYQLNALELVIGWMAGAGAWFGCFYYLWVLAQAPEDVPIAGYPLIIASVLIPIGHLFAMRFHRWGRTLYLWTTGVLLVCYALAGWSGNWMQVVTGGSVFWFHTGVLPLHLLLFGLPKARHLVAHQEPASEMPAFREAPKPPSYLLILSALTGGVIYLIVQGLLVSESLKEFPLQ